MGAGVAYVRASAGLEVVLIDRDQASADKGKAHSEKLISTQIAKGRAKSADRDALLAAHPRDAPTMPRSKAATSSSRRCSRIAA